MGRKRTNDVPLLAHKITLDPTPAQAVALAKAAGTARFAWNWALAEWQRQYTAGEKPTQGVLRRQLNAIKREQFPWMLDSPKTAPQQAIKHLQAAYERWFAYLAAKKKAPKGAKPRKVGAPQFKKKGQQDAFRADNGPGTFAVHGRTLRLPVLGTIKLREPLRFSGQPRAVTISKRAGRWYASILVDMPTLAATQPLERVPTPAAGESQAVAGVDLGITRLASVSDGTGYDAPKPLRRLLAKLRRCHQALSRKQQGSANRRKARECLARLHARIADVRADALHKATTDLVRRFPVLGIEDLNVQGMQRNRALARAIGDVGLYEFRRQLTYKAALYGTEVIVADRWFPSSKTCSACGQQLESLPLSVREWTCPRCGAWHERDANAARNLERLARNSLLLLRNEPHPTGSFSGSNACGDGVSPPVAVAVVGEAGTLACPIGPC